MTITEKESEILFQHNKVLYKGVIEDNNDPEQMARYKVRILGIHSNDKINVPTSTLPWATTIHPMVFGMDNGVGISSIAQVGTWVWCMFDNDVNYPVIVGAIVGGSDIDTRARNDKYTKVHTIRTASNHIIEIDDMNNAMRLLHNNGCEVLLNPNGIVITSTNIINISATGEITITSDAPVNINSSDTININASTGVNITSGAGITLQSSSNTMVL